MKKTISLPIDSEILDLTTSLAEAEKKPRTKIINDLIISALAAKELIEQPPMLVASHRRPKQGQDYNITQEKPWEALGISRRTWYRRYRQ